MKKMTEISIDETDDGEIFLSQPDMSSESGYSTIIITKEQLPIVISWLQEMVK